MLSLFATRTGGAPAGGEAVGGGGGAEVVPGIVMLQVGDAAGVGVFPGVFGKCDGKLDAVRAEIALPFRGKARAKDADVAIM